MKKLLLAFAFVTGVTAFASAQTGKAVRPESKNVTTQPAASSVGFSNASAATQPAKPVAAKPKQKATARKTAVKAKTN